MGEMRDAVPVTEETGLEKASTVNELAALPDNAGTEIIRARIDILGHLRRASIAMTSPEDWLTFKRPDGRELGYLSDSGCERIRDLWGIEIKPAGPPERIAIEGGHFMYVFRGTGMSNLTKKTIHDIEGGRGSDERFCDDKKGALLELAVRKAARANLDGSIVRELTGLSNVPREELESVWKGTGKRYENCAQGRGYSDEERRTEQTGFEQEAPHCPKCNKIMRLKKGKTGQFWGCSGYPDCKKTLPFENGQKRAPDQSEASPPPSGPDNPQNEQDAPPSQGIPGSLPELKNGILSLIDKSNLGPSVKAGLRVRVMQATDANQLLDIEAEVKVPF